MNLRPSPGLVVGLLALVIALGGTSYAAGLAKDSVASREIDDGSVRSVDVRNRTLTGADIRARSIPAAALSDKCRKGAVRALGGCVSLVPEQAASHQQAIARCGARGGRLPTVAELRYLSTVPGLTWADGSINDYEFANATIVTANLHHPVAVDGAFNDFGDAAQLPAHYHCIV